MRNPSRRLIYLLPLLAVVGLSLAHYSLGRFASAPPVSVPATALQPTGDWHSRTAHKPVPTVLAAAVDHVQPPTGDWLSHDASAAPFPAGGAGDSGVAFPSVFDQPPALPTPRSYRK